MTLATCHCRSPECVAIIRSFAVKDEIFCLFEGALDNLGSLKQQYGLANEVVLDPNAKAPLYWGITGDGYVAFADDADWLKGLWEVTCFFPTSYENTKNKITEVSAEEEIWGAKFMQARHILGVWWKGQAYERDEALDSYFN
ncbi:stem-specific protein TSJT1 [Salvia divinorum]|uniref:Stem-specific protein TSJT1 n=1 Tax=Salvia divinorum TaxID=28513 RepID=A0ABD1GWU9_SALDI